MNSNISYTNKDFNSIYVELLEYAKKLSYRWDPSASDESDPGVVLLKLAAIIGDKDNYNIDKNILELMPASVQQLPAARQLFEQCGYYMHYYRAAKGLLNITIKQNIKGSEEEVDDTKKYEYTIPMFTMFTDTDKSVVYTSTEKGYIPLKSETPLTVMQGVATQYNVNNDTLITVQNLDYNNRLYFSEDDIAENGIFITNVYSENKDKTNYEEWTRVDNLLTQTLGQKCYKFGLTIDNSICYIEFPEDIESLMGEGLNITYIRTTGSQGNVTSGKINDFYTDTYFTRRDPSSGLSEQVQATSANVTIRNIRPISDGKDVETIDDAYKGYKRVKNTFDTLVSLKDYTDYMITSEKASNGYVCDRTNDIQHTYKIKETDGTSTYTHNVVDTKTQETEFYTKTSDGNYEPAKVTTSKMSATNLCVYALNYEPSVTNSVYFKSTFNIVTSLDVKAIEDMFNGAEYEEPNIKSLQHDFISFEPYRILMLKNKYSITANIVPKYTLSSNEKIQVINNVEKALYEALNSKQLNFGESVNPELIQDVIMSADERVKTLIDFISPEYETYAVYIDDEGNLNELRIDDNSYDGKFVQVSLTREAYNQKIQNGELYYLNKRKDQIEKDINKKYDPSKTYFIVDDERHDLWVKFRVEIFSKNILCGVTPLYQEETSYMHGINQFDAKEHENITQVSTNTNITFTPEDKDNRTWVSRVLEQNENVVLYAPNFVEETNYSTYVKLIYSLKNTDKSSIESDTHYELTGDDFILFIYKLSDSDLDYTYIRYDASSKSKAKFIMPSGFNLNKGCNVDDGVAQWVYKNTTTGKGKTNSITEIPELGNKTFTNFVKEDLNKESKTQVLTGTDKIITENVNEIHINNNVNGCNHIYWFLNNTNSDNKYQLFSKGQLTYILKSGEYFIYTNEQKTAIHLLGEGTKIRITSAWEAVSSFDWCVTPVSYDDFIINGVSALEGYWANIKKVDPMSSSDLDSDDYTCIWATEQQQINIGPKNILTLDITDEKFPSITSLYINSDGVNIKKEGSSASELIDLSAFTASYTNESEETVKLSSADSNYVSWNAYSILNINMSPTKPQRITKDQRITYEKSENGSTFSGVITGHDDYNKYILSDTILNVIGGNNINLLPAYSTQSAVNLMEYAISDKRDEENSNLKTSTSYVDHSVLATITVPVDETTTSYILNYTLPQFQLTEGSYLLQVDLSRSVDSFNFSSNTNIDSDKYILEELFDSSNKLKKLFKLDILDPSVTIDIKLQAESSTNELTVLFNPLYKYNTSNLDCIECGDSNFEDLVLEKLEELDPTLIFNHIVIPTEVIANPLESNSFFNSSHFYNKFTICEWDTITENDMIKVHDVAR